MPRTIEYLIQLFPDKTGKELLEIQEKERQEERKEFEEFNKRKLELIKDYNENGAYFKGRFGQDQYYMYNCYNFEMDEKGRVTMSVDSLTMFNGDNRNDERFGIKIELRKDRYEEADKFALDRLERITKEEWEKALKYLFDFRPEFWEKIDMGR